MAGDGRTRGAGSRRRSTPAALTRGLGGGSPRRRSGRRGGVAAGVLSGVPSAVPCSIGLGPAALRQLGTKERGSWPFLDVSPATHCLAGRSPLTNQGMPLGRGSWPTWTPTVLPTPVDDDQYLDALDSTDGWRRPVVLFASFAAAG